MPPFLPRKRLRSVSPEREPEAGPSRKKGKAKAPPAPPKKPTLFEDLDAGTRTRRTADHKKAILEKLVASEDDTSSLSSLSDDEFEDVPNMMRIVPSDEEDEDIEFEDVDTTVMPGASENIPTGDLELTLRKDTRVSITNPMGNKKGPSKIERQIRISTHQCHVQLLMFHNAIRNAWLCDKELQETLISQLPPSIEQVVEKWRLDNGLATKKEDATKGKGKGKIKNAKGKSANVRSQRDWGEPASGPVEGQANMGDEDPVFRLLEKLVKHWKRSFRITAPGVRKVGYMSLQRLDEELKSFQNDDHDPERHGERFENIQEFKEQAKAMEGSRDFGAQLFTALLRGIGLEARMVASLQPVGFGWSQNEEASEKNPRALKKPKPGKIEEDSSDDDDESSEPEKSKVLAPKSLKKGKEKSTVTTKGGTAKKSQNRSSGRSLKSLSIDLSDSESLKAVSDDESVIDVTPAKSRTLPSLPYDKDLLFPHYWTEVLSPATNTYVPVDAIVLEIVAKTRQLVEKFEPRGGKSEKAKQVAAYIVGHSPDGTAKDITTRYLKGQMWPGRTKGVRYPVEKIAIHDRKGKVKRYEQRDWFKVLMNGYVRGTKICPRTEIDDHEEATDLKPAKREKKEIEEGKETLQYYKTSSEYVLERHLRREEALVPTAKHVKMFAVGKGDSITKEKVFLRKDVVNCKSTETWHKEGRAPKPGEEPLKRVPFRAATTNRKRELAEAEHASGEKMLQPLFSHAQTEWIIPPPIENGIIPKNSFGNIDLYVDSMLPQGAAHIPYRGTVKICKRLEIDYAEAVTGFEFGHRMAVPVIEGVVIAEEHYDAVIEEWHKDESERVRKEDEKRKKAVVHMWRKMLMGLRIVERVREEYGDVIDDDVDVLNPFHNKSKARKDDKDAEVQKRFMDQRDEEMAGGFLPEGFNVEEPEERQNPSFFPVAHEDDEDDEDESGGGFIVEGHEKPARPLIGQEYATPQSLHLETPKKHNQVMNGDVEMEDAHLDAEEIAPVKKRGRPAGSTNKPKLKTSTPTSAKIKVSNKRIPQSKRQALVPDSEEEESHDVLSPDIKSEVEEPVKPQAKKRAARRVTMPAKNSTEGTRKTPRRAARKSETELKSKYFEHSDDHDDDEQ